MFSSSRVIVPSGSFIVDGSCFSLSYAGSGGCIYLYNIISYLTIRNCVFWNCITGSNCSAIHFESKNGQCITEKVCAFRCYSTKARGHYMFGFFLTKSNLSNFLCWSSIVQCAPDASIVRFHSMRFEDGIQKLKYNNVSSNSLTRYSGISNNNTKTFELSYSTFSNNLDVEYCCLRLDSGTGDRTVSYTNIVNCTQIGSSFGIILLQFNGEYNITNSNLQKNNAVLFYIISKSLHVRNCNIDHVTSKLYVGSASFFSNQMALIETIGLSHFSTFLCQNHQYETFHNNKPLREWFFLFVVSL